MVAQHSFTLRLPLPTHIRPEEAVAHLQAFESLITPHPYLVRYERRPVALGELVDDPFFREDGMRLSAYVVTERIKLMAGMGKDIQIPAVFQSFHNGVRCRADASAGVRVWSSYEVSPRKVAAFERADEASVNSSNGGEDDDDAEGYDLVERVTLTCNSIVKRFVVKSIEPAHKEICERMIEEMMDRYREQHMLPGPL
jgi:hypothetical protein